MIPYEQLAAALERHARGGEAPAPALAPVSALPPLEPPGGEPPAEFDLGDVLSDEEAG